jgi:tetratricopeptide (TPR) repeat protein
VAWLTLGADYLLWGMAPFGYHLTSLMLHAAGAATFFFVAAKLLRLALPEPPAGRRSYVVYGAALSALLFAVHPLRAESVVWASERKDVLCGLFFLLTILCYLKAAAAEGAAALRRRWLGLALGAYVLALLSKSMAVSMPLVLLALDIYPLRRLGAGKPGALKVWLEKLAFAALALGPVIVALYAQKVSGAVTGLQGWSAAQRAAQAAYGLVFYLWKTVWPSGLSPLYQPPASFVPSDWPFLAAGAAVLLLTGAAWLLRRRRPALAAIWGVYVVMLLPVLGFVSIGPQFVADRYSYLACLGWVLLPGAGLVLALRRQDAGRAGRIPFAVILFLGVAACAGLGGLTVRQAGIWRDTLALWTHALAVDPGNYLAHNYMGSTLVDLDRPEEALVHYRESLRLKPSYADARYNLAVLLPRFGKNAEAEAQYRLALADKPDLAEAHHNLGVLQDARGEYEAAFAHYLRELEIRKDYALAHYNIGNSYYRRREMAEAAGHYRECLRLRPGLDAARRNLALALAAADKINKK